jgi:DNA-binding XRE family transcriptional regulator
LDQERDELMADSTAQARPANPRYAARPRRRPGRKPKGSVPVVVVETPPRSRELIASLASRRAELALSQEEVARRMQTSQATVAYLEAQLATLARYAEALGLLTGNPGMFAATGILGCHRRLHP